LLELLQRAGPAGLTAAAPTQNGDDGADTGSAGSGLNLGDLPGLIGNTDAAAPPTPADWPQPHKVLK
jgi:hypothetical protein